MSTFNGQVLEFPDIRVDFFRPSEGSRPALACFLSHVHSDHLSGLESFKGPFVYCSAATREILLRLERFPHRLNFQRGLLESRKQTYRHLKYLLKPLPLETPTTIELAPGKEIRVTLFDANHCTGAVMFLIEGDGKAILYTGDIRSEPWHVNNLRRNPILMPYACGLKKLDCIYLDTTFTEDIHFPTKAEGLTELLTKIERYPEECNFHFKAWTFGYEEVWIALSTALRSPVHVDEYKIRLYKSLCPDLSKPERPVNPTYLSSEAPALIGHWSGNKLQNGCLTLDPTARVHSCELGMRCPAIKKNTIFIQPILARGTNGVEMLEVGAGGGEGDLTRQVELEFDSDKAAVERLLEFLKHGKGEMAETMKADIMKKVQAGRRTLALEDIGLQHQTDDLSMDDLIKLVAEAVPRQESQVPVEADTGPLPVTEDELPRLITFPYSRHSSYEELCDLVAAFKPADVYPCTVDERRWYNGATMKTLFGQCCDDVTQFRHDKEMLKRYGMPGAALSQGPDGDANDVSLTGLVQASHVVKRKAADELGGDGKRLMNNPPSPDPEVVDASTSDHSDLRSEEASSQPYGDLREFYLCRSPQTMTVLDGEPCEFCDFSADDAEPHGEYTWDEPDEIWRCNHCFWERVQDDDTDSEGSEYGSLYESYSEGAMDEYECDSLIDDNEVAPDVGSDAYNIPSSDASDTEIDFRELSIEDHFLLEEVHLEGIKPPRIPTPPTPEVLRGAYLRRRADLLFDQPREDDMAGDTT